MRVLFAVYIILTVMSRPLMAQESDMIDSSLNTVALEHLQLSKINIVGNKKTRRSIILREMSVQEGDSIVKAGLADVTELNRKRVFNLSLFTDVVILTDSSVPGTVTWDIVVKEQWYLIPEFTFKLADRNFNVWWVEQDRDIRRANIGVTLKNRNFRGNLEEVSATAQVGYTQKFGLQYYRPYIDKNQKHGFGFKFFLSRNEEWFYKTDSNKWEFAKTQGRYITNSFETSVSYILRPAYASRHLLEASFKSQTIQDTITLLNSDYFLNGKRQMELVELLYRYDLNMVDNWNYPMHGLKVVVHSIFRIGIKGFNWQNVYMAEIGRFNNLGKKFYSSHIFRGRIAFPEKQPYVYVSAMGVGNEYIRGYEYYVIDGSHYGILRNNLKYELLNIKIKKLPIRYISTLPFRLYPKVYTDVGYGRNKFPGNSTLNNRLLYSAGAGIDIVSAYDIKLRVEYTWNHLGEKGLFLHFTSE